MSKNPNKTGKRRPATKRSSLSPRLKAVLLKLKILANKEVKIPLLSKAKKIASKKKVASPKTPKKRQLIIPLGRSRRLTLVIDHRKPVAKKPKANNRVHPKLSKTTKKIRSKKIQLAFSSFLLIAGLSGAIFFGVQTIASPIKDSPKPIKLHKAVSVPKTKQFLARSTPVSLRIPAIELDGSLTSVGLAADGSIEVPPDYTIAGWYRDSPTPGEIGPAIIVGHLDNIHGLAVFWRLRELIPGQTVEVTREDGKVASFTIEKVVQVPQDESFPSQEVYGNTDKAALRLITCGGTFNHLTQRYSDNTIVFASMATPASS